MYPCFSLFLDARVYQGHPRTSFWILDDNPFHYLTFFLCFIPLDSTTKFSCLFLHCPFLRHKMFWSYNLILIVMIKWNRLQEHNGVAGETVPRETVFPRIWTPSKCISSRPPVCQIGKPEPGVQRVNITPNFFPNINLITPTFPPRNLRKKAILHISLYKYWIFRGWEEGHFTE